MFRLLPLVHRPAAGVKHLFARPILAMVERAIATLLNVPCPSVDQCIDTRYLFRDMAAPHTIKVDWEGSALEGKEKRHPRERFTKHLIKMCNALDEVSAHDFEVDCYGETLMGRMEALELWVVGSYARGACTCADLDVVVNFHTTGSTPSKGAIQRQFFGSLPLLRVYDGTPEENRSGVPFTDAVLIWTKQDTAWQDRITSIKLDPNAGRAPRDTDIIPLRPEQMYLRPEELQRAVEQHKTGLLEWEFIPFNTAMLYPIPEGDKGEPERHLHLRTQDMGKKTKELIPAVWRLARRLEQNMRWECGKYDGATLICSSTLIHIGRPTLPLKIFDKTKFKHLVLIPHLTARGPNGAWVIRRGPNHPHWPLTENRTAYYVSYQGKPTYLYAMYGSTEVPTLELFANADEAMDSIFDVTDEELEQYQVCQASGRDLYNVMVGMEVVEYEGEHLSLTRLGAHHAKDYYQGCKLDHTLESFMELFLVTR